MSDEYNYESWPLEARIRFEAAAMEAAINGEGTLGTFHASNWQDKPHRVLRDAIKLMLNSADELAELNAQVDYLQDQVFNLQEV